MKQMRRRGWVQFLCCHPSNSKDLGKQPTGEGHKCQLLTSLCQEDCSTNLITGGSKVIKAMATGWAFLFFYEDWTFNKAGKIHCEQDPPKFLCWGPCLLAEMTQFSAAKSKMKADKILIQPYLPKAMRRVESKTNLRQDPECIFWFVFSDGLNLKSDLRSPEMQGIQIQVQTSYLNPI